MNDVGSSGMSRDDPRRIVAMAIQTFSALRPGRPSIFAPDERASVRETAVDWQKIGMYANWFELLGTRITGIEQDRLHELAGCIAAAGEQLGLAWTADQEIQRWHQNDEDEDGRRMAVRALADICAHFCLGAAHGMANATTRTLTLLPEARPFLQKAAILHAPFTDNKGAWPSFSNRLVTMLAAAAHATQTAEVAKLVDVLRDLRRSDMFQKMEERRGLDYHRWRPQSISGGVPQDSFWGSPSPGVRMLRGYFQFPADPRADPQHVAMTATNGMEAVATAMDSWTEKWDLALRATGIRLFQ